MISHLPRSFLFSGMIRIRLKDLVVGAIGGAAMLLVVGPDPRRSVIPDRHPIAMVSNLVNHPDHQ